MRNGAIGAAFSDESAGVGAMALAVERVARELDHVSQRLRLSANATLAPGDLAFVRALIAMRRARGRFFAIELFGEPTWDILLDLTRAWLEKENVSVSSLCIASNAPTTTALRYIRSLVDEGLLVRVEDLSDRRRTHLEMSPSTRESMLACLAEFRIHLTR